MPTRNGEPEKSVRELMEGTFCAAARSVGKLALMLETGKANVGQLIQIHASLYEASTTAEALLRKLRPAGWVEGARAVAPQGQTASGVAEPNSTGEDHT